MSKRNWIKAFAPLDRQRLLQTAAESVNWIEQYGKIEIAACSRKEHAAYGDFVADRS